RVAITSNLTSQRLPSQRSCRWSRSFANRKVRERSDRTVSARKFWNVLLPGYDARYASTVVLLALLVGGFSHRSIAMNEQRESRYRQKGALMASPKRLARIAGFLYLIVGIFGGFAIAYVTAKVYVP